MFNKLKNINEQLLNIYQDNEPERVKQNLIKLVFQNPNCFIEIDINIAYSILRDLKIPETELKTVYLELIDSKNYRNN
ncbi:MAG: hypothetical protein HFI36_03930 [Bacilli bacterium]|jgi:hypothetical protein|nr:hypothetical protein [Bacilli bacterium]